MKKQIVIILALVLSVACLIGTIAFAAPALLTTANATDSPLALVSIHQNSIEGYPEVCGIEAWTYDRSGCNELAEALSRNVSLETGAENRGVHHKTNLVVTSKTTMPAVIIECGYMSNPNELTLLQTENYQLKIAAGIANAVDEFVEDYYGE